MSQLHRIAVLSALNDIGIPLRAEPATNYPRDYHPRDYQPRLDRASKFAFMEPNSATFTSDKPLTKRQKRRLRGRAKAERRAVGAAK